MKNNPAPESGSFNLRILLAVTLCVAGGFIAALSFAAPSPSSGTLSPDPTKGLSSITYTDSTGSAPNPSGVALGAPNCTAPNSCSTFNLTIDPSVGVDGAGYVASQNQIFLQWQWSVSAVDYDVFIVGPTPATSVVAKNQSTADPSTIILPTTTVPGTYKVILALSTGAPIPYTGTIQLQPKPAVAGTCTPGDPACAPPRYRSYPAGSGQADNAGEPALGVDWNPNVAGLKDTTSPDFTTGVMMKNTGGVAFFTSGSNEFRVNFDDCPSPAVYSWEDVSAVFDQTFVLSDPGGFVDHYSSSPLGLSYPPPHTPGRVFAIDLIGGQGDSLGAYSDDDGNSYLPGGNGGPGAGPDHETIGGGPYSANQTVPISHPSYPNAVYYCSQNIVAEAQCSRSDDGGQTFGPGIPIFTPSQCTGGIHGHAKVAPDGTVYVPNSSCGTVGTAGAAVSTDNGITWTERNVVASTSSQDPSVGIGQNHRNQPGSNLGGSTGTNTVYLGYTDGDGHPKVVHSGDRGANWSTPIDVGNSVGVTHAVFPVVVAGDDDRAAFAFVGTGDGIATTGTCNPYGAVLNCKNIWHMYVATTYDGGSTWITTDVTPDDPVQQGTVCLEGTTCAGGRNLLDFNDFAIDSEGRGLIGYADGCVNCTNTFTSQSGASHGTVTRQSGGRRLFAFFDPPAEPTVPAAPQLVSAVQPPTGGVTVTWLEPDNGGSPITGYDIFRGPASGAEAAVAIGHVDGNTTTKFFDPTIPVGTSAFYYVEAINAVGIGTHCGELGIIAGGPGEDVCVAPGLTLLIDTPGIGGTTPGIVSPPAGETGYDLLSFQLAQPYQNDQIPRLIFQINTDASATQQHQNGTAWYVSFKTPAPDNKVRGVRMVYYSDKNPGAPTFERYEATVNTSGGSDGRFVKAGTQVDVPGVYNNDDGNGKGRIIITVKASDLGLSPGSVINGFNSASIQSTSTTFAVSAGGATATIDEMPDGLGYTNTYTVHDAQFCNTAPTAALTASPLAGPAPLTVNFDGTTSSDPDPGDSVASYHFDFGDGASTTCPGGTGCTSPSTADHTYNTAGEYPARLTVTDSRGKTSTNPAQVVITVTSPGPPVTGVVSRKRHGTGPTAPNYDVVLPLAGAPGVECRTGPIAGTHKVIFGFENNVTGVSSVSASAKNSSGTTAPVGATPGTTSNPKQFVVDLTGVPNPSRVTITLHTVTDSANNSGDVSVTMGVLTGDVNASAVVTTSDVNLTKAQALKSVTSSNFRSDIDTSGAITTSDVNIIKTNALKKLP